MTNYTYTETEITVSPDWKTKIRADYSQAACPIQCLRTDDDDDAEEDWVSTPFQVADAGHRDFEAVEMVAAWLKSQA